MTLAVQPIPAEIFASLTSAPTWYPQKLDLVQETMLFVSAAREDYAQASFLDDRMLGPETRGLWMPIAEIARRMTGARARPRGFIFHIGHCGSTLLSRLFDLAPGTLGLREPLPLRALAEERLALDGPASFLDEANFRAAMTMFLALWGRVFDEGDAVIVKATSGTNDLAASLLRHAPDARAVALHLRLEPFLATLLAGPNSHLDLRGHAKARMIRFARDWGEPPKPLPKCSTGELAGLAWAVEMAALGRAVADPSCVDRIVRVDFEGLLGERAATLQRALAHLGLDAGDETVAALAEADIWRRYSKAPEHDYSPELRAEVLDGARAAHAGEIAKGRAWVDAACARSDALAAMLASFL